MKPCPVVFESNGKRKWCNFQSNSYSILIPFISPINLGHAYHASDYAAILLLCLLLTNSRTGK